MPPSTKLTIEQAHYDEAKQIIYGAVAYANILSSAGQYFTPEVLKKMAIEFLPAFMQGEAWIDLDHDNNSTTAFPTESFYVDYDHPIYPKDSWILGLHIESKSAWQSIISGKRTAYSAQFMCLSEEKQVAVECPAVICGITEEVSGHTHSFIIQIDPETGQTYTGRTSVDEGHYHDLKYTAITDNAIGVNSDVKGHAHPIFTIY